MNLFNWISIHLVFCPGVGESECEVPFTNGDNMEGVEVNSFHRSGVRQLGGLENLISLITIDWFDITVRLMR